MEERYKLTLYRGKWCIKYYITEIKNNEISYVRKRVSLRTTDRIVAERRFEQWKTDLKRTNETSVLAAWNTYFAEKGNERKEYAAKHFLPFFSPLRYKRHQHRYLQSILCQA